MPSTPPITLEELLAIGYTKDRAEVLLSMTPEERMVVLPVIGNAFSDRPLFECCYAVLNDPSHSLSMKRLALVKLNEVVGEDYQYLTDKQVLKRVNEFMKLQQQEES